MRRGARLCAAGLLAATLAVGGAASAIVTPAYAADETESAEATASAIAEVGGTQYSSLQEAVNNAKGETIKLLGNVSLDQSITVNGNTINIDGNDNTIQLNGCKAVFNDVDSNNLDGVNSGSISVSNTKFVGSGNGSYVALLGFEANGVAIDFSGCSFTNFFAVVLCNPVSNASNGQSTIDLTGNTFNNVNHAYSCDDGYTANGRVDKHNFTVDENAPEPETFAVASVDGVGYTDLSKAIDAASEGDVVEVRKNVTLTEKLTINKSITLDLGGKTITGSFTTPSDTSNSTVRTNQQLISVDNTSNVTIENGTIVAGENNSHALNIYNVTGLTLAGDLRIEHNGYTGAPLVVNASSVAITGSLTTVTSANSWYAINVDSRNVGDGSASLAVTSGAKLSMEGATPQYQMGIYVENSEASNNKTSAVTFADGSTVSTSIEADGFAPLRVADGVAGITVDGEESVGLVQGENGAFVEPTAFIGTQGYATLAAAVAAAEPGDTIELTAGEHEGNLELDKELTIVGPIDGTATIVFNDVDGYKGFAYDDRPNASTAYPVIYSTDNLTLKNVTVAGPTSTHHGIDGIYVNGGDLTLDNVTIRDIRCTADGGKVCGVQYGSAVLFTGDGNLSVTNCSLIDFQKNALMVNTSGDVLIEDSEIRGIGRNNIIAQNGIVLFNGQATIRDNTFSQLSYVAGNEYDYCSAAIDVFGDSDAVITGNAIDDSVDNALYIEENASVDAYRNKFLAPVGNYTDATVDLSKNYWGDNPDWSRLILTDDGANGVSVFPRYADAAMTQLVDENNAHVHSLVHFDRVEPTETEPGSIEFWYCGSCKKFFSDAEAKTEIAPGDISLPATGGSEEPATQHMVTFVYGFGQEGKGVLVNEGETVAKPADPTYEGYKFVGWFTTRNADNTVEDEYDFSTPVTGDLKLYAGWVKDDAADQTPTTPETGTATENDKADAGKSGLAQTSDPTTFLPAVVAAAAGVTTVAGAAVLRKRQR
ncbi:InlB B-repeat-containing protein [Thermophilibacter sp.]